MQFFIMHLKKIIAISKLRDTQTTDAEYVIDLENINKYISLTYKDLSKDGFKLRTENTGSSVLDTRLSKIKVP